MKARTRTAETRTDKTVRLKGRGKEGAATEDAEDAEDEVAGVTAGRGAVELAWIRIRR